MREFCYQILRKCESVRERIKKVMLTVVGSMDDYCDDDASTIGKSIAQC